MQFLTQYSHCFLAVGCEVTSRDKQDLSNHGY